MRVTDLAVWNCCTGRKHCIVVALQLFSCFGFKKDISFLIIMRLSLFVVTFRNSRKIGRTTLATFSESLSTFWRKRMEACFKSSWNSKTQVRSYSPISCYPFFWSLLTQSFLVAITNDLIYSEYYCGLRLRFYVTLYVFEPHTTNSFFFFFFKSILEE